MTNIKISILHCSCKIHVLDKQNWQWFPMNKATWIAVFLLTYTCTIILLTSVMVYTCTVCTPAEKDRHVYQSECRKLFILACITFSLMFLFKFQGVLLSWISWSFCSPLLLKIPKLYHEPNDFKFFSLKYRYA